MCFFLVLCLTFFLVFVCISIVCLLFTCWLVQDQASMSAAMGNMMAGLVLRSEMDRRKELELLKEREKHK